MGTNLDFEGSASMTSKANTILSELISILQTAGFQLVTRRKLDIQEIADNEFDAVIIEEGNDSPDFTGVNARATQSIWRVSLTLHVISSLTLSAKEVWYEKSALIGRTIAANRQFNGVVELAAIVDKSLNTQIYEPFASGTLGLTIKYRYNELTQGG